MQNSLYKQYIDILVEDEIPDFLEKYLSVPSFSRLKNICYFCGMDYASKSVYDFKESISRYDHSLSTALLIWKFTKNKVETIAGLFHDVATPCFSHVIDYMNKDYANQESTEEYTAGIIKSDKKLLECLKEDGISPDEIADFKNYKIVDSERPKLCADRLDGVILTGIAWTKALGRNDIEHIINDVCISKNELGDDELGFKNEDVASRVLNISNEIDRFCHTNENNFMMELLAKITKMSIESDIISYDELYHMDEPTLFNKIKLSDKPELKNLLYDFENITLDEIPITVLDNVKIRDLDPLVLGSRLSNML